ncbi:hypothetical protein CN514_04970 [Bacillus sp. AFS001701]|nr:hypothetical protein CN514_04970 [Bacillus sp. AFS001701]
MDNVPKGKVKRFEKVPDWMLAEKAVTKFKEFMSQEEAFILWNNQKEFIVNEINKQKEKMLQ